MAREANRYPTGQSSREQRTVNLTEIAFDSSSSSYAESSRKSAHIITGTWNGTRVAVKRLLPECRQDALSHSALTWYDLRHPNVSTVVAVSSAYEVPAFVVLPYHENGNMAQWTARHGSVDRASLIFDVVLGMQYLHARKIIHGSLRPSNILINSNGRACVSDYDLLPLQASRSPDAYKYYSPEAWRGILSRPSDVFAFAMCAYELFSSTPPWGVLSEKRVYRLVVQDNLRPDRPDSKIGKENGLDSTIWGIIEEAWAVEPRLRPNFDIILRMWQSRSVDGSSSSREARSRPNARAPAVDNGQPSRLYRDRLEESPIESYHTCPPAYSREALAQAERSEPSPEYSDYTRMTGTPNPRGETPNPGPHPYKKSSIPPVPKQHDGVGADPSIHTSGTRDMSRASSRARGGVPLALVPGYRTQDNRREPDSRAPPHSAPASQQQFSEDDVARSLTVVPQSAPPLRKQYSLDETTPGRTYFTNFPNDMRYALPSTTPSVESSGRSWRGTQITASYSEPSDSYPTRDTSATLGRPQPQPSRTANWSLSMSRRPSTKPSVAARPSPHFLVQTLQSEVKAGRRRESIDVHLIKMYECAVESDKDAFRLVNAGAVPLLIHLLKTRAADEYGVELILITLGTLAYDPVSANTIHRTGTAATLVEIADYPPTPDVGILAIWCLNRICRSPEVAQGLVKQDLTAILVRASSHSEPIVRNTAMYCLGTLMQTDALAEFMASTGIVPIIANHLRLAAAPLVPSSDGLCSGLYAVARISRSIKLAKAFANTGCIECLAYQLRNSTDPEVLHWAARAAGCLMRPNSNDMAKILLDAGVAQGLARLPTVLPQSTLHPLGSFGFTIQRFSCAQWGGATRKALVEAGVVDALLAALRVVADERCQDVHVDLALAVSLLGDVGGTAIRKEIVNAGGIDILRTVGQNGAPEVSKACRMAVTSVTGNVLSGNAASAKTALAHNWNGGCPDYYPTCPLTVETLR
ncbi:hypothetical protein PM082_004357 [Marasmius tenuissimus]|nr:hypothetical protein PM082_004357 [Marasmius tenuissimus]